MKLRAIHIIFARAVVCWLQMQSNHRIGKNRRAENPPALLYFALVKEVSVQSCFTSIWKRKCLCSATLLRFGKGSVCAVLLYFTLVKEVFVQLGQGGILSLSPKVTSKSHLVQLYSPLPGFSPV